FVGSCRRCRQRQGRSSGRRSAPGGYRSSSVAARCGPATPNWVRTMLERTAREFLAFEVASRRRHDAAAAERRACREASRALRRPAALRARIPDMAAAAGIIAQVAAAAQTRATPSRGGRRADVNRDWLLEQMLFIWQESGGATRTSTHGGRDARRGGPLVRFL